MRSKGRGREIQRLASRGGIRERRCLDRTEEAERAGQEMKSKNSKSGQKNRMSTNARLAQNTDNTKTRKLLLAELRRRPAFLPAHALSIFRVSR